MVMAALPFPGQAVTTQCATYSSLKSCIGANIADVIGSAPVPHCIPDEGDHTSEGPSCVWTRPSVGDAGNVVGALVETRGPNTSGVTEGLDGVYAIADAWAQVDQWSFCSSMTYPGTPWDCGYAAGGGGGGGRGTAGSASVDGQFYGPERPVDDFPTVTCSFSQSATGDECWTFWAEDNQKMTFGTAFTAHVEVVVTGLSACLHCTDPAQTDATYHSMP